MENQQKPLIIFDTDMDTDCDDAGAFAMLANAHLQNKISLVGIIADSVCRYAAPCCEVMSKYYGIDVPVGTVYADDYTDTEFDIARFADYCRHSANCLADGRGYNRILALGINKTDTDYRSAANTYRKILAEAEDNSITVLCVGMLTAVAQALDSAPDGISPLSGVELFRKKVKHIVTMGNPDILNDFNWGMDAYATERFFELCPVPIYISAEGADIITGAGLSTALESGHPIRQAYEIWTGGENRGRSSWDLIAALYAIDPDTPYLLCKERGNCRYDAGEKRLYTDSTENPQCRTLHANCSKEDLVQILSSYL